MKFVVGMDIILKVKLMSKKLVIIKVKQLSGTVWVPKVITQSPQIDIK